LPQKFTKEPALRKIGGFFAFAGQIFIFDVL